ncbi:radical SAM protein [Alkaliphilus transvaalensis]|uniref:radical SAM protein n=1 Tax=Alkaliphilus transvaalensis TaxID=114628 RepID=UPI0004797301|nr:radical SAM protein [Alkaliphilus transvaalensis]
MEFQFNGNMFDINNMLNRMDFKAVFEKMQSEIKEDLVFRDSGMTVLTKSSHQLSKGCEACKTGTWWCLFMGSECNATCKFCPQSKKEENLKRWTHPRTITNYWIDDVKFYFNEYINTINGVSYSGGEPFLYLEKIIEIAEHIVKTKEDTYQWVYTNGKLINKEKLLRLKDCGIKEVRVDLAATDFDVGVIKKLSLIREVIGKVTVEVPSIPITFKNLIGDKVFDEIISMGVEQLNLAELQLSQPINWEIYATGEDVYHYDSKFQNTYAPVYSRIITLNIMKYVIENKLDILVNDCSIDAKHLQILKRKQTDIIN